MSKNNFFPSLIIILIVISAGCTKQIYEIDILNSTILVESDTTINFDEIPVVHTFGSNNNRIPGLFIKLENLCLIDLVELNQSDENGGWGKNKNNFNHHFFLLDNNWNVTDSFKIESIIAIRSQILDSQTILLSWIDTITHDHLRGRFDSDSLVFNYHFLMIRSGEKNKSHHVIKRVISEQFAESYFTISNNPYYNYFSVFPMYNLGCYEIIERTVNITILPIGLEYPILGLSESLNNNQNEIVSLLYLSENRITNNLANGAIMNWQQIGKRNGFELMNKHHSFTGSDTGYNPFIFSLLGGKLICYGRLWTNYNKKNSDTWFWDSVDEEDQSTYYNQIMIWDTKTNDVERVRLKPHDANDTEFRGLLSGIVFQNNYALLLKQITFDNTIVDEADYYDEKGKFYENNEPVKAEHKDTHHYVLSLFNEKVEHKHSYLLYEESDKWNFVLHRNNTEVFTLLLSSIFNSDEQCVYVFKKNGSPKKILIKETGLTPVFSYGNHVYWLTTNKEGKVIIKALKI